MSLGLAAAANYIQPKAAILLSNREFDDHNVKNERRDQIYDHLKK